MIQKLYEVERQAREPGLSPPGRKELRLGKILPVINELGKRIIYLLALMRQLSERV